MYYSDDPVADFERYDSEQQRQLEKLPVCDCCDEPIQDDYCYEIGDELFCEECMNDTFRKHTENFIKGW